MTYEYQNINKKSALRNERIHFTISYQFDYVMIIL